MENYDPEVAARVWQRVQGKILQDEDLNGLPAIIVGEWQDAATYLRLSRQFKGKETNILRKMFEEEQSHAACLKGIYTLQGQGRPDIPSPPTVDNAPVGLLLRRCYGREMRCLAQYEARVNDPEYGQVFARMAGQEREHCRLVLELLGSLPEDK